MHLLLAKLIKDIQLTGDVLDNVKVFLTHHDCLETLNHCMRVADEARRLAVRFDVNESSAEVAAWLHDISAVFHPDQYCEVARRLDVEILPEERVFPAILHQKLSHCQ